VWSSNTVPATPASTDTASVVLGMKFRSKVAGYVLGVRFYKGVGNNGTHSGYLWTKNGALLATVKFSNETKSGWQQANFSTPVAIAANTTYVISYLAPKGGYPINTNYFTTSGADNGPLHALSGSEEGGNDVYRYGSSGFPTSSWNMSNYWVDVVFNTVPSTAATIVTSSVKNTLISSSSTHSASGSEVVNGDVADGTSTSTSQLSCSPKSLQAGDSFDCLLRLSDSVSDLNAIAVSASSADIRLPAFLSSRSGKRSISFRGSVDPAAGQSSIVISAGEGETAVSDEISVTPSSSPVFSLPGRQFVRLGSPVSFIVSAQDGSGLPVDVSAATLPEGASFDAEFRRVLWTPAPQQAGESSLSFGASNSVGATSSGAVPIVVDSGDPIITKPELTACTPGSIATIRGRWLSSDEAPLFDPSGASLQLGDSTIRVNGLAVPILSASPTRLTFLCPDSAPGTDLDVSVETAAGSSVSLRTTMLEAKPRLLLAPDSTGDGGYITFADSDSLATVRDVRQAGEPAQPEDLVVIRATGLGSLENVAGALAISIGGIDSAVESVSSDPDAVGVVLIRVRVPAGVSSGTGIPVQLTLRPATGPALTSNTVSLAIE
jgi:uncharacterized protein (TIGR03437 family)